MESARWATSADLGELIRLAEAARVEVAGDKGGEMYLVRDAPRPPVDGWLTDVLAGGDGGAVLGEFAGVPFGLAVVRTEALPDGSRLGVVDAIYVEEPARGVGVGEAMMELVLQWCSAQGCRGVDSTVLPGNREGKNFFERFGLVARAIRVHRDLR